ncbi:MAG: GNAT family N-acetyltransferase [Alphaproteobacteria bacterium]
MTWLQPVTLEGKTATLAPLAMAHHDDLVEATKDGELWNLWYTSVPTAEKVGDEIERRRGLQETGSMLPFTIIENATGQAVGMTTYMNIDAAAKRVEIGSTWYRKRVQRGPMNTECKLLLLQHAFETLDCIAVEFRTHRFNTQSQRAIERLGAKLDGVLRNHQVMADGSIRDTCAYSIINSEWQAVKTHLTYQLNRPR